MAKKEERHSRSVRSSRQSEKSQARKFRSKSSTDFSAPQEPVQQTVPQRLVAVGKIVGVFGIAGFVKIHPYTQSVERLRKLRMVQVGRSDSQTHPDTVDEVIIRDRVVLMKLHSNETRTLAEQSVGQFIFIDESEKVKPPKGTYFIDDLIGCEVRSEEGAYVGIVEEVYPLGAQDLWAVRTGTKVQIIPAVKEFIKSVDVVKRIVVVKLIDGLIEKEAAE